MKLTKTKKIILLGATIGVLIPSIVTPIVLTSQSKDQKDQSKEDVLKVIKILEEKSLLERQIELNSDAKGKIIANNQEEIIKKIKQLIGESNLKGVSIEILMEKDKDISTSFQEIKVKVSKENYSQEVKKEKTIFVKRSKTISELALIELNLIKDSLKALGTKVVNVYTSGAINQKITTNKLEILKAIQKISGYDAINLDGASLEIKNSEELLPINSEDPVPITIVVSKSKASVEVVGFSAKQMSLSEIANIDLNFVKNNLESLNSKLVEVDTTSASDHKISTNKVKILEEIKNLNGYSNIDLKGVNVEVKDSETLLAASNQDPTPITLILSKSRISIEVSGFKAKSLSNQQILKNTQAVNLVKSSLEALTPQTVDVYTSGAIDQKITTNKVEILKSIKKINGYSNIDFRDTRIEVKDSEDLLPDNDQSPIPITLVLSKPGVSIDVTGFSAKQMSASQIANIDLNLVKKDLESLIVKTVEVDISESGDQKITTNKVKILEEIAKLNGYSNIDFKNVNVEVKNSEALLPTNDQDPVVITLVLSKANASPNNIEISGFSAKQQIYIIKNIKTKIIDKDILIAANVSTQNQSEIQLAILEQLKVENNTLTNEDLEKMTTNISSLNIGTRIEVELTITHNGKSQIININVEKINLLKGSNITDGTLGTFFEDSFKNLWSIGQRTRLQVLKKGNNSWTNNIDSGLTKNSNITDGRGGVIFQDRFKNLWAMGNKTSLQVLRVNQNGDGYDETTGWTNATNSGLTNGSNITNGNFGTIFQDDFNNLWTIGFGTKLQVLRSDPSSDSGYVNSWTNDNSETGELILKNSNFENNWATTIFQDEFKNLWTLGNNSTLQVLRANSSKNGYEGNWNSNPNQEGLVKGSNVVKSNVIYPKIFQDKFQNLWTMGGGTPLQVLRANSSKTSYDENVGWTNSNSGLTKNSNIVDGEGGTIFQDSFGNLWTAGKGTKLQVLKVKSNNSYVESWASNDEGEKLLNGFNNIGRWWTIFQDKFKNLWVFLVKNAYISENNGRIWVLKYQNDLYDNSWNESKKISFSGSANNLFINKTNYFIDSSKNVWIMNKNLGLVVIN